MLPISQSLPFHDLKPDIELLPESTNKDAIQTQPTGKCLPTSFQVIPPLQELPPKEILAILQKRLDEKSKKIYHAKYDKV